MEEVWKICPIAPEFEVSTWGRVRWEHNKKWAVLCMSNGYQVVNRSTKVTDTAKQEQLLVHRMVAITFIDGYEDGLVVNHIDGCRTNNRVDNLEWVTARANLSECYNSNRKYDQEFMDMLYDDYRNNRLTAKDLSKKYDIAQPYVGKLLFTSVHSKDIEPIKMLYTKGIYNIQELSSIYKVADQVIENIIGK